MGHHLYAALAQSVEHFLGKEEVGGSNPLDSFISDPFAFADGFFVFLTHLCLSAYFPYKAENHLLIILPSVEIISTVTGISLPDISAALLTSAKVPYQVN